MIRTLDFVIRNARNVNGERPHHVIDAFCREDTAHRLGELRNTINNRIPKKYRV